MDIQTKQKVVTRVIIAITLIACIIVLLLIFLPRKKDSKKENYEFFNGGVRFDYIYNISDKDKVDCKWLELYCQDDGSLSGGKYYVTKYEKGIISSYDWYDIDNFTLSGSEITINFEKEFGSVHGTFNDSWTSIMFTDAFPPIYNDIGWRFNIREKT